VLAIAAVVCTVALTAIVVTREFRQPELPTRVERNQPPSLVGDWNALAGAGHRIGQANAPLTVLVFSDFECPACARFANETFPSLQQRYGDRVALVYRHWPLSNHKFAYAAARASECAAQQGQFDKFHAAVYRNQGKLGLKSFRQFASESGVPDLVRFDACTNQDTAVPAIEKDIQEALKLEATGTPTVIVNGWYLRSGGSKKRVDSIAQALVPLQPK
jgi:protein-disulfide isomerase